MCHSRSLLHSAGLRSELCFYCIRYQRRELFVFAVGEESISKAQLRLTDIAENLESDWIKLAEQLGITAEEMRHIQFEYHYVVEQVSKNSI